jgi:hypothetical protein
MTYWPNGLRDLVADAVEVVEREVDLRLAGDRQQVQDHVRRAAEGHRDGDGVLERLLGEDVAGGDAETEHVDDGLTRTVREVVAAAVGRGRRRRAGKAHPECFGDRGHGVGRVHPATGALARGDGALDALEVFLAHVPGLAGPDRLEGVDDRDLLLRTVAQLDPPWSDRTGVQEHRGEVETRGRHEHARQRLVATREQDGAVQALGHDDGLDAVGDDLSRHEREVHALVPHRDAVGDGDRAELERVPATGVDAFLGALCQAVEREVAGRDLVPRARDADLGLVPVLVAHADGAEHTARGGRLDPVGDGTTAWFDVDLWHFKSLRLPCCFDIPRACRGLARSPMVLRPGNPRRSRRYRSSPRGLPGRAHRTRPHP